MRQSRIAVALLSILLPCAPAGAAEALLPLLPEAQRPGFEAIDVDSARTWLEYLAGPECAGRGTGEVGYERAAAFMAARFRELGLSPIGDDGSYFQNVPFVRTTPEPNGTRLTGPDDLFIEGNAGLGVARAEGGWSFEGEVVFARVSTDGDGVELPSDFDAKDKALVLVTDGRVPRRLFGPLRRIGAAITIRIDDAATLETRLRAKVGDRDRSNEPANERPDDSRAPRVTLTTEAARRLALALGVSPDFVDPDALPLDPVVTARGDGTIRLTVRTADEELMVPNVVGLLEGGDPDLAPEHYGVGAHLDHLGVRDDGTYFGADDDGSGCVAVLLVAKALAANPVRPRRGVVFLAFCGEEIGLIGSRYYTEAPILPLDKMVCLLQMDMVGRNEEKDGEPPSENENTIHLVGSRRISQDLHDATLRANEHVRLEFEYDEEGVYRRSDHYNFARKGVPITFLFSGFHPDYHRSSDTIDKINFEKILNAARLNYFVIHEVDALGRLERNGSEPDPGPSRPEHGRDAEPSRSSR